MKSKEKKRIMKKQNRLFKLIFSNGSSIDTGIYSFASSIRKQNSCSKAKALRFAKRTIAELKNLRPEQFQSKRLKLAMGDEIGDCDEILFSLAKERDCNKCSYLIPIKIIFHK